MIRRNFLKGIAILPGTAVLKNDFHFSHRTSKSDDRSYWLKTLLKIAHPVLHALSENRLKSSMPVEAVPGHVDGRRKVTHLEALGRTLAGLAPWLENKHVSPSEDEQRTKYFQLTLHAIHNAVTPSEKDYLNFTDGAQPLVDAAFLAHALLRAPSILNALNPDSRANLITALKSTRAIKAYENNWLLFSAMVEAALLKCTGEYNRDTVEYALRRHEEWYKGDGVYGDGPEFHFDYYNSFVIQPMMLDILQTINSVSGVRPPSLDVMIKRAKRYGEIQERLISPEGTFPPTGRSLAYRCGAFQLLAQLALQKQLPVSLTPSQVRGALTAVIRSTMEPRGTFDSNGWLTLGFAGHQPVVAETYISTGSLYLCTVAFLPLGLPSNDEFWIAPPQPWTSKLAFGGEAFKIDRALY